MKDCKIEECDDCPLNPEACNGLYNCCTHTRLFRVDKMKLSQGSSYTTQKEAKSG